MAAFAPFVEAHIAAANVPAVSGLFFILVLLAATQVSSHPFPDLLSSDHCASIICIRMHVVITEAPGSRRPQTAASLQRHEIFSVLCVVILVGASHPLHNPVYKEVQENNM